ncbi:MAG: hypothetical protein IKQ46_17410 [Bacteroidales bacterium]|nr:hypothetical protein [Bacteroidales bacterium]
MARIANPIYDAAFKYLMDEPRVAKTLIAAVLKIKKSDIIELTPDRNEIITTKRDEINACRLDFSVRIQTETGVKSIYIELQKAWAKGEMKRFRSYLAAQYTRASNVGKDNYPLPILSIYILGEKVDHLDGAVTYITRHYYNQEGLEINQDKPSWFVECLSHNMVVIQIPKIKPRPDSSLDNLLTMFDQSKIDPDNHHVICYDIDDYDIPKGELRDDMRFIVRRLEQATVSEEIRMKMDLEDKVEQMLFEKRSAEEKLVEQEKLLQEQASQLQQQKSQLQEKDSQLQEQASQLQQQTARITKSIQKMYSRGESIEEIAEDFEVSVEFVKEVLKSVK